MQEQVAYEMEVFTVHGTPIAVAHARGGRVVLFGATEVWETADDVLQRAVRYRKRLDTHKKPPKN